MHKLVIEDDEGKAVVVPLIRDEITIGRQEGNTIRLTERNVSRRHARLMRRGADYILEDLSSYTGTKVNGSRIATAMPIKDGDQVVIGDYKLGIRVERPTASTMAYPGGPSAPAIPPGTAPMPAPVATSPTSPGVGPMAASGGGGAAAVGLAGGGAVAAAAAALAKVAPQAPPHAARPATSAPPEPLEGAPTVPVRTLADQGLGGPLPGGGSMMDAAPSSVPPARLVVMTQPLAGQEHYLDRASLVIGRTAENDIVLNHKSISRHHAKIIRDGDRYIVVDLESANGVRVNGAEYERIELQTGDVLELGHVRLRFVTGDDVATRYDGDAFRFGSSARKPLVIGAGAAVVLAVVAAVALSGKDEPKSVALETAAETAPAAAATTTSSPAAPARGETEGTAMTPGQAPATGQPAGSGAAEPSPPAPAAAESGPVLLARAKASIRQEKWGEAQTLLAQAVAASPGLPEADELRRVVETEKQSAAQLQALERAAQAKDFPAVRAAYAGVAETSIYKPRARAVHDETRAKLVAQHLGLAERRRLDGNCQEARSEAEAVLALEPQNRAARDVITRCSRGGGAGASASASAPPPVAAAPGGGAAGGGGQAPAPRTVNVGGARPARSAVASAPAAMRPPPARPAAAPAGAPARDEPASASPPGAPDPDELLQQAQDAWLKGQYAAAIEASRRALRAKPGLARAYQIIAVCSCSLRDGDSAARAYERLDETNKKMVKQLCQKSGVTID